MDTFVQVEGKVRVRVNFNLLTLRTNSYEPYQWRNRSPFTILVYYDVSEVQEYCTCLLPGAWRHH